MWSRLWTIALSLFEFLTSNRRCNFGLACLLSILLHNRVTIFTKPFSTYITNIGCELPFCISFSFLHQTVNTILALPACFQTLYFWFPKISVIRGLPVPFCLSFSFFHQILNTILAFDLRYHCVPKKHSLARNSLGWSLFYVVNVLCYFKVV